MLSDYDCSIHYHLNKVNVVTDALSKTFIGSLAHIEELRRPLIRELHELLNEKVNFDMGES